MTEHPLQTVLATSDLSEGSDAALQTASVLAGGDRSAIRLFHCVPRRVPPYWKGGASGSAREERARSARQELERQSHRVFGDAGPAVELTVAVGAPVLEITRFADQIAADVLVLGQHYPRMAFDDLLGTTTDRLLRMSDRPCLIAHRPITSPIENVLVATDFSKHARKALETVVDWLAGPHAPERRPQPGSAVVEILHVHAFGSPLYRPFFAGPLLDEEAEAARSRLPRDSRVTIRTRTYSERLEVEGIAAVSEEMEPDLIVLGTHGYGFLTRALLGSNASAVARTVRHPLLLVPLHARADRPE